MERAEWLKKVRRMAESLYDHGAPAYWVDWGVDIDDMHREYIEKFLRRLRPKSYLLDAACGAGRFDRDLYNAGHTLVGIDQSRGMLARAREHYPLDKFPRLSYLNMGLQEMDFPPTFDGIICMDAMEHICPEDWPLILMRFQKALKPLGIIYLTVDILKPETDRQSYERAHAIGLPVVYGEVVDELESAYAQAMEMEPLNLKTLSYERLDHTVYHFHPSLEQSRLWFTQAGFTIAEEEKDNDYVHVLAKKEG